MSNNNLESLVSDIQKLYEGADLNALRLHHLGKSVTEKMKENFSGYKEPRIPTLRLSNVGRPLRQLWFDFHNKKSEKLSPETKLKFQYGDILEEFILFLAEEAGYSVTDKQREVEVDGVLGHIDGLINGVLVDVKSASSFSWNKFASGGLREDDPFGYIGQLSGYSTALGGVDGAFLVVDKTLGKLCLDQYSGQYLAEYNVRKQIEKAKHVVAQDKPPEEYCYEDVPDGKSGNMKLAPGCSYCSHKWECREGLRGFAYSYGPAFLTKTIRTPNVPEIYKGQ